MNQLNITDELDFVLRLQNYLDSFPIPREHEFDDFNDYLTSLINFHDSLIVHKFLQRYSAHIIKSDLPLCSENTLETPSV